VKCLDLGQRPAAFLRVREGLGLLERFLARANRRGEPVLFEFGRLRLPPARWDVFGGDGDRLETRFREGEGRGGGAGATRRTARSPGGSLLDAGNSMRGAGSLQTARRPALLLAGVLIN
jgi:hypothetical protein